MEYLKTLNENQKRAVVSEKKYIRVNAGAGSGKTRVLTYRIAYLIDFFGVSENSILAITFTNKVAKEMKERLIQMLNRDSCGVLLTTYHSFCARVLREDISILKEGYSSRFTIVDDEEQKKIVKDLLKSHGIDSSIIKPKEMLNYIGNKKCSGILPFDIEVNEYEEEIKVRVYQEYEEYLNSHNYLDFDDLLLKTYKLFMKSREVRYKWSHRYSYILVDEFQDTNDIQYALLRLLINQDTSLFVVGDPDQTIYSWRGANINLILNFNYDFNEVEDIILDKNYRSTQKILDVANTLIDHNTARLKKDLYSDKKDGNSVQLYSFNSTEDEAKYVCEKIKDLHFSKKVDYKDIAILYRSSYYTRSFEQEFLKAKLPYRLFGGVRFYQRKEVKDVLAYLRLVVNPNDEQALTRIINEPKRGIGEKTLENIRIDSKKERTSMYEIIKTNVNAFRRKVLVMDFINAIENAKHALSDNLIPYSEVIENLLNDAGYIKGLRENEEDEEIVNERLKNISELYQIFMELQASDPTKDLAAILQDIALYSAQDDINDGDYVSLMTVHTAKGLEFPYVFLIGMQDGVFPNSRSQDEGGIEEERRLCYVALTRAKDHLFISYNTGYSFITNGSSNVSLFIREIEHLLENKSKKNSLPSYLKYKEEEPKKVERKVNAYAPLFGEVQVNNEFRPGNMVSHVGFGEGIVISVNENHVEIAFKRIDVGVRKISKSFKGLKIIG